MSFGRDLAEPIQIQSEVNDGNSEWIDILSCPFSFSPETTDRAASNTAAPGMLFSPYLHPKFTLNTGSKTQSNNKEIYDMESTFIKASWLIQFSLLF